MIMVRLFGTAVGLFLLWVKVIHPAPALWREWKKQKGKATEFGFTLAPKEKYLLMAWAGTVTGTLVPGWLGYITVTGVVAVVGGITILGMLCWLERREKC